MRRCLLVVVALLCAGCGGSHDSNRGSVTRADLRAAVLQPGDLPGFSQFADGEQIRSDAHPGPRNDPARFGRTAGWITRYKRDSAATRGPLVVESRADLFGSADGAAKDLAAYGKEYEAQIGSKKIDAPELGDDARAFSFGSASDRFVLVAWRDANVSASVLVEGLSVDAADAARLARKQERRLSALVR